DPWASTPANPFQCSISMNPPPGMMCRPCSGLSSGCQAVPEAQRAIDTPIGSPAIWAPARPASPNTTTATAAEAAIAVQVLLVRSRLDRVFVPLAGPDANRFFDRGDEDLPVTDLPGLGCRRDPGDDVGRHRVRDHHLDPDLGDEVHDVGRATIDLGL